MSHIRNHSTLRALPVFMAGGVGSGARVGLDSFHSLALRYRTATPRRLFNGIATQH